MWRKIGQVLIVSCFFATASLAAQAATLPEHPAIAFKLHQEAEQLRKQGDYAAAERRYQRALTIWEKNFGPNHPSVAAGLSSLADLRVQQGRYQEAETLYQRALTIWESSLGKNHPATGFCLRKMYKFYELLHRFAEAESLCQRAAAIFAAQLPQGHPDIAATQEDCRQLQQHLQKSQRHG